MVHKRACVLHCGVRHSAQPSQQVTGAGHGLEILCQMLDCYWNTLNSVPTGCDWFKSVRGQRRQNTTEHLQRLHDH